MRWSYRLGTVTGVPIYMHTTLLLLLSYVGWVYYAADQSLLAALSGVGFILALFGCVLLHELGHVWAARSLGIGTRDITLLPIGGLARLEEMPERPRDELWVAIAGPLVNVAIAAVLLAWLILSGSWASLNDVGAAPGPFVEPLLAVNIMLVVFNMIPAFPMDGGRVLRALLTMLIDRTTATQVAASIGRGFAVLFGFIGLSYSPMLVLIAIFIWFSAGAEARSVATRGALGGAPVDLVTQTQFASLRPHDTLTEAVALTLSGSQKDFPVLDSGGRLVGLLRQQDLIEALATQGQTAAVGDAMEHPTTAIRAGSPLPEVLPMLHRQESSSVPVVADDMTVLGMVSVDGVFELLQIRQALAG